MNNHRISSVVRLIIISLFALCFICFSSGQGSTNKIRIKFDEKLSTQLKAFESKPLQKSKQGYILTGITGLDKLALKYKITGMNRVFRPAGKFEARHQKYNLHLWYEISMPELTEKELAGGIDAFSKSEDISHVEREYDKIKYEQSTNYTVEKAFIPSDPLFSSQWHYYNTGQTGGTVSSDIKLPDGWDIQKGSSNVIVAVMDGGIDKNHEDLSAAMWINETELNGATGVDDDGNGYIDDINGYGFGDNVGDFKADNHGTHVGGTIGAINNNGIGVSGVAGGSGTADGVRLMSCATFGDNKNDGFPEAFVYAADMGAVISQNSWGYSSMGVYEQSVLDAIDYFIQNAGKDLNDDQIGPMSGGLVIFAAGNSNSNGKWYPGYYESVLAVSSITHTSKKAYYSNYGTWVDVAAPGGETNVILNRGVLSTLPGNSYGYYQGTSMACPHVSGVAALIVAEYGGPGLTPQNVWNHITDRTDNIDAENPSYIGLLGSGRVNALNSLLASDTIPPAAIKDLAISGVTSSSLELTWTSTGASGTEGKASSYEIRYAQFALDSANFNTASLYSNPLIPKNAGETESINILGLLSSTQYFVALKALDSDGNASGISNIVYAETDPAPIMEVFPDSFYVELTTGESDSQAMQITNSGAGMLLFSIGEETSTATSSVVNNTLTSHAKLSDENKYNDHVFINKGYADATKAVSQNSVLFFDNMENGTNGWTTQVFQIDDLWHQTTINYSSANHSWYCGIDANMNYNTGRAIETALISPEIDLTSVMGNSLYLNFSESYFTEPGWDKCMVDISINNGTTWTPLRGNYSSAPSGNSGGWVDRIINISSYIGQSIRIRFYFDTRDAVYNTYAGWFVDNVSVSTSINSVFWLSYEPEDGSIASGNSSLVNLYLNAEGLLAGGDYYANICISGNDPLNTTERIPVHLHINGTPILSVNDTVIFEDVYINSPDTIYFDIMNTGTEVLLIDSVIIPDGPFGVSCDLISLDPGFGGAIKLSFAPTEIGTFEDELLIYSNDISNSPAFVKLIGNAVLPPTISVSHDSLSEKLSILETSIQILTISNTGGLDLNFTISIEGDSTVKVATKKNTRELKDPENATIVKQLAQDPTLNTISPSSLPIQLAGSYSGDHLLFGISNFGEILPFQYPIANEYLQIGAFISGYTLAYMDGGTDYIKYSCYESRNGIVPVSYNEIVNNSQQVIVEVVNQTNDGAILISREFTFDKRDKYIRVQTDLKNVSGRELTNLAFKELADWDVDASYSNNIWNYDSTHNMTYASNIHFASIAGDRTPDYIDIDGWDDYKRRLTDQDYITGPMMFDGLEILHYELGNLPVGTSRSLINAYGAGDNLRDLQEAIERAIGNLNWISSGTLSGTVPAGSAMDIEFNFNATSISSGDYYANIAISSNDPKNQELIVPASLQVHESLLTDSLALVALYNSTNGPGWINNTNWLTGPLNTWFGVSVENGRVAWLNILDNNLSGEIPSEIGYLTHMQTLALGRNSLTGNIPPEIGNCKNLRVLFLISNRLSGSIPKELGNCKDLLHLHLRDNELNGHIPTEICYLPNLRFLDLSSNQLTGSIPKEIGNLTLIIDLTLGKNEFTGSIPDEIGNLSEMGSLLVNDNQFTGAIPSTLGNLLNLSFLRLNDNQFSGAIPTEIVNLSKLWELNLESNQFTELPDLSSISTIEELLIANNQFTYEDIEPNIGVANTSFIYSPQDMIGEEQHIEVNWGENSILFVNVGGEHNMYQWFKDDGYPLPGEQNDTLRILNADLSDQGRYECRITNTVATELTIISRPIFLNVITKPLHIISPNGGENWLIGSIQNITWVPNDTIETVRIDYSADNGIVWNEIIPTAANYGSCSWVVPNISSSNCVIRVSDIDSDPYDISDGTFIIGEYPINVADSLALVALYNSTNGSGWANNTNWLTGRVSTWYGITVDTGKVNNLSLTDNNLIGTLPPELGDLTNLNVLAISHNSQLTGNIPKEMGNLRNLGILYLPFNQLTGSIPAEIANCGANVMYLQGNRLSGGLGAICLMPRLCFLDMSSNQLTGNLPKEFGSMQELGYLDLNFNQLTGNIPVELGNMPKLQYLHLENNQLTGSVPKEIGNINELQYLNLKSNLLTGRIPIEIGGLTKLKDLNLANNLLDELPSLVSLTNLEQLYIQSNRFSFEDIEQNIGIANTSFTYSPQDLIGEAQSATLYLGDDYNYTLSSGGEHNVYQWYKDGSIISGANKQTLSISYAQESDAGVYFCKVTNTLATELTLFSRNITITINEGMPEIDVSPISWNYGYILTNTSSIKSFVINNTGTAPLKITNLILTGGNASEFSVIDGEKCIIPPSGSYTFQVVFTPQSAGSKSTILRIPSNDKDENPIDIPLTGIGILPNTPPVVSIPEQTVSEGNNFSVIYLDNYVSDDYTADANISWSFGGNSDLSVSLNGASRTAIINAPDQNWYGSETISFYATDKSIIPLTGNKPITFTITPVNDIPVLDDIPDQSIQCGISFSTIDLSTFISDIETPDADIVWTYTGNSNLSVKIINKIASITPVSSSWTGIETITFIATDNDPYNPESVSESVSFTIDCPNLAPVITDIPNQSIDEGASFVSINLENYVSDDQTPTASISWSYSGNTELIISIINRIATVIVPDGNWNGSEAITFTATDNNVTMPLSASNVAIFTVNQVNDQPNISDIPDQLILTGEFFAPIVLNAYVSDIETTDEDLDWTTSGCDYLSVSITDHVANVSIPFAGWTGCDTICFTVTDNDITNSLCDSEHIIFTVMEVNQAPVVVDIPDQTIDQGETFESINLDSYVEDDFTADEDISWIVSENEELDILIQDRVAIITAINENWHGSDILIFTAKDDNSLPLEGSDEVIFTVNDIIGIHYFQKINVNIYPNPVSDNVFIAFENAVLTNINIEVVNVLGEIILVKKFEEVNDIITLNLGNLTQGAYFIKIESVTEIRAFRILVE